MEADATKVEVQEALRTDTEQWTSECKLSEIRSFRNDTTAITMTLPRDLAKPMYKKEELRVGLVKCSVERRVVVHKCTRCWSHNHKKNSCKGPDITGNCYKCGKADHKAQNCREEEYCPLCEATAHSAGNASCPRFRE
nr:uncharacterized protein LOC111515099 [Leptinotarsa decemlineata]